MIVVIVIVSGTDVYVGFVASVSKPGFRSDKNDSADVLKDEQGPKPNPKETGKEEAAKEYEELKRIGAIPR